MSLERDLTGYGSHPPRHNWLGGSRLGISLVVNYEEGSERTYAAGDPQQESLTEWGAYAFPANRRNLAMESMYEYGSRVGVWRILRVLEKTSTKATFFACAQALELAPAVAEAVVAAEHEVCSHGWRWEEVFELTEEEERAHIRLAVDSIARTCGRRPVGWYCRYGPSERTRRLLVEEGGFLYDSDSYADDIPFEVQVEGVNHLVIPYSADSNDIQYWLADPLATTEQFFTYLKDAFDTLYQESEEAPRMMSVGLHCRIIGRPGRIAALERFIDYAKSFEGVAFMTREEIALHWRASAPPRDLRAADVPETVSQVATLVAADGSDHSQPSDLTWSRLFLDEKQVPATTTSIGKSHVIAGDKTDVIRHETEEVCLVVKGNGELRTDLGTLTFKEGDALHIPAGCWHCIVNTGDIPAEMVFSYPGARMPHTEVGSTGDLSL